MQQYRHQIRLIAILNVFAHLFLVTTIFHLEFQILFLLRRQRNSLLSHVILHTQRECALMDYATMQFHCFQQQKKRVVVLGRALSAACISWFIVGLVHHARKLRMRPAIASFQLFHYHFHFNCNSNLPFIVISTKNSPSSARQLANYCYGNCAIQAIARKYLLLFTGWIARKVGGPM